jgi:PAS domain S-box-containing protein
MAEFNERFGENMLIAPDGIIVIGCDFNIITFNDAAERITGFRAEDIIGMKYYDNIFGKPAIRKSIKETLDNGIMHPNLAVSINCSGGMIKDVLASITPVIKEGQVLSVIVIFRDTQEMQNMASELSARTSDLIDERNKLEAIFNSNIEGTFTIDNNWIITSFNTSAAKITGYKKEEAVGSKCWEIFRSSLCRNGCHMEKTMSNGKATIGNELEIYKKNGKNVPIRVNSGILINNKGEKIGAVETFIDISEIKYLSAHITERFKFGNIIGNSKAMDNIFNLFESVSRTDSTVLLTGESGTGKELAARAIHLNSARSRGPFVALNCSAFAENLIESELFGHQEGAFTGAIKTKIGKFELAQGGTLFLDEIGDISQSLQVKLLRVLEMRQFERVGGNKPITLDARIITATNKELLKEISDGKFREDFYYRINVINIHLPALRERTDDLPLLLDHFIKLFNKKFGKSVKTVSKEVYDIFCSYKWPGNIRELENIIEHSFILCRGDRIETEHIPVKLLNYKQENTVHKNSFFSAEREVIMDALEKNNWNKKATAEALGIDTSTLWRKMKKFSI